MDEEGIMRHHPPRQPIAIDAARIQLEEQRREILGRIAEVGADLLGATSSQAIEGTVANHPADAAGELLTAETDVSEIRYLRAELVGIDEALRRIHDGSYGYCVECGMPLDPGRLEALPQAARCVACQRRHDYEAR